MLPIYLHTPFPFNLSPLLSTYSFPFQPFSILYLYTPFPFNLSPLLSTYSFPFQPFSILYLYTPFPFNLSPSFIYILLFLSTFLHLLSMYSFPCQPFFPPLPIYSLPCSKPSLILYLYTPFPVNLSSSFIYILLFFQPVSPFICILISLSSFLPSLSILLFFSTCLPLYLYTPFPVQPLYPLCVYSYFLLILSPSFLSYNLYSTLLSSLQRIIPNIYLLNHLNSFFSY